MDEKANGWKPLTIFARSSTIDIWMGSEYSSIYFLFFCFLRPKLSPWRHRNRCFLVPLCYLIVTRPNLEAATKRQKPFAGKNSGTVSESCCACKRVPAAILMRSLGVISCLLQQMSSQWGSQKLLQREVSLSSLT